MTMGQMERNILFRTGDDLKEAIEDMPAGDPVKERVTRLLSRVERLIDVALESKDNEEGWRKIAKDEGAIHREYASRARALHRYSEALEDSDDEYVRSIARNIQRLVNGNPVETPAQTPVSR